MTSPNPAPEEAPEEVPTDEHHGEVPHDDDSLFDDGTGYVP